MPQPNVRDVMTTDLVTAPADSSLGDVAAMLATHRISAVPLVDRFNVAVGIVSWTDIGGSIERGNSSATKAAAEPSAPRGWFRRLFRRRRHRSPSRWRGRPAAEVMTGAPVTIAPDASLAAAGRVMHQRDVGRLLVVDHAVRLVGVVTRRDLLKVHNRLDAVIREEILHRVLRRTLLVEPGTVRVTADDGRVTLSGRVDRRSTAQAASGLAEAVAGVTDVVDRLTYGADDTASAPSVRRRPGRRSASVGHGFAEYAAQVTREEVAR